MIARADDVFVPAYPLKPTSRGHARLYYEKRWFYFGRHATSESYELYAEWLRQISGDTDPQTLDMKAVRDRVKQRTPLSLLQKIFSRSLCIAFVVMVVSGLVAASALVAYEKVPKVDAQPLSDLEIEHVRQMRMQIQAIRKDLLGVSL